MREILFRGKRVDNGEWVYGNLIEDKWGDDNGNTIYAILQDRVAPEIAELWTPVRVAPETVGQYTGLKDKNGTKIFEGDICKTCFESYTHSWEEVGVVTEFCGAYGIESADGKHFRAFINETVYTRSCEVIGKIHDNPELLKEDKQ